MTGRLPVIRHTQGLKRDSYWNFSTVGQPAACLEKGRELQAFFLDMVRFRQRLFIYYVSTLKSKRKNLCFDT
jgi:hypothetical protein